MIFLINISRRELHFWDETPAHRPTWDDLRHKTPSTWKDDHEIVCYVRDQNNAVDLLHFFMICGHGPVEPTFTSEGLLNGFIEGPQRKRWHLNDFYMLPLNCGRG